MERLFVIIARINSVLLLLVLSGAAVLLGWFAVSNSVARHHEGIEVPADTARPAAPVVLRFAGIETIVGAHARMMMLATDGAAYGKFSSGGGRGQDTRNVVFLADADRKARWLFPKHDHLIAEATQLSYGPEDATAKPRPTLALYFEIVGKDTDGDGRLSRDDLLTVALARPDGQGYTEVLQGVGRVLSREMADESHLALIYQVGKSVHHARFAVPSLARESDEEIVSLPDGP